MPSPRSRLRRLAPSRLGAAIDLKGWLVVAWVLWWSWCYYQTALLPRFPQLARWTRWPW